MSQSITFWVAFALFAAGTSFASVQILFVLGLNTPVFTTVLVRLLKAKDYDRYQKLLRAAGDVPASVIARRAFELRERAVTYQRESDIVVGYRDRAPVGDFVPSLRGLVAPDLSTQRRRILQSWWPSILGFFAPALPWFFTLESKLAPIIATVIVFLLSIYSSYRALQLDRGLDTMLGELAPLLDPRGA